MDNQPRQSKSSQKSTGSKDAKSLKHNKNRDLEAPAMPDLGAEMSVAKRLGSRGHGAKNSKVVEKVLQLVAEGRSFTQIDQLAQKSGLPRASTLRKWKKDDPDFAEEVEGAFSDYVDDLAKRTVPYMEQIFKLRGLDDDLLDESEKLLPTVRVAADGTEVPVREGDADWRDGLWKKLNFHISHGEKKARAWSLGATQIFNNIAPRRVETWRDDSEGSGNMIVFDINIGDPKSINMPGSPDGQNAGAAIAVRSKVKKA